MRLPPAALDLLAAVPEHAEEIARARDGDIAVADLLRWCDASRNAKASLRDLRPLLSDALMSGLAEHLLAQDLGSREVRSDLREVAAVIALRAPDGTLPLAAELALIERAAPHVGESAGVWRLARNHGDARVALAALDSLRQMSWAADAGYVLGHADLGAVDAAHRYALLAGRAITQTLVLEEESERPVRDRLIAGIQQCEAALAPADRELFAVHPMIAIARLRLGLPLTDEALLVLARHRWAHARDRDPFDSIMHSATRCVQWDPEAAWRKVLRRILPAVDKAVVREFADDPLALAEVPPGTWLADLPAVWRDELRRQAQAAGDGRGAQLLALVAITAD